jgi:methyl coenzyme M reductase subunit D
LNCREESDCVVLADVNFVCDKAAMRTFVLVLGDTTVETSTITNFVSFGVEHDELTLVSFVTA